MVDRGEQIYFGGDGPLFHDGNLSPAPRSPVHQGTHNWLRKVCGDDGTAGTVATGTTRGVHTLSGVGFVGVVELAEAATFVSTHTLDLVAWSVLSGPALPGPAPGSASVSRPWRGPASGSSALSGARATLDQLPELEELEPVIQAQNLSKMRSMIHFEEWVDNLRSASEGGAITFEFLEMPEKSWPSFPLLITELYLERKYNRDVARGLARVLARWSEQHLFDEEHNFRTIEEWANAIKPIQDF